MDAAEDNKKPTFRENLTKVLRHVPGAALLFAVVPLLVLGYLGWFHYGAEHLDRALYSLKKPNLSITAQPAWIRTDVLEEVFRDGRLGDISLLDPNANATIAQAFETHNWVKSASRVTKSAGGKVEVDLIYRRPAAMVYYAPQENSLDDSVKIQKGFYPIDEDGIILPTDDFDGTKVYDYFMIFAAGARPAGDIGMSYGDARISEALALCAFLENDRARLGLQEIWVDQESLRSNGPSPWEMTIFTKDKYEIRWGHAPRAESANEPAAIEKQQRMVAQLEHSRARNDEQRKIDLRSNATTALPVSAER